LKTAALYFISALTAAHGFFQLAVDGGYSNMKFTESAAEQNFYATTASATLRFFYDFPGVMTIAIGPYLDAGTGLKASGTATYNEMKIYHAGGEFALFADRLAQLIAINPYVRAGYGYEEFAQKVTGATILATKSFHAVGGFSYKIFPWVHLYADAGITSTGWRAALGSMIWFEWGDANKADAPISSPR